MARPTETLDPTQIATAAQIPPPGAQRTGLSPQGLVDVFYGTLLGDVDARPAAKELLEPALDTGGRSNVDYVYGEVSALFGGAQLPHLQSPSSDQVQSLVFVSGSHQGGYGAFHIGGGRTQAEFDRIVVDSLTASGSYSAGSSLGSAIIPSGIWVPRLLAPFRGPGDLLGVIDLHDPRINAATTAAIRIAGRIAAQSILAFQAALEAGSASAKPAENSSRIVDASNKEALAGQLIEANQELLGLRRAMARAAGARQYLSTALFAAEVVESFQTLTHRSDPGKTDGEALSRLVAFKLAPELSLVPGFNTAVTQQWWSDGHPDFVRVNSESDQSSDGNAAGVMFLLFLNDYLGIAVDEIIRHIPTTDGAPLGQTYTALVKEHPALSQIAGVDGNAAFEKMVSLLQQNAQTSGGILSLPANGNPFPSISGANQGGLFAA